MRWDALSLDGQEPALFGTPVTVDTPEFRGITFHEIRAKSIINKVPGASRVPFTWTINPYRGCSHACRYCFARKTHTYLDFDAGHDFDSQIVVKVNAPELVRRELASPRWRGEHIAMGTNVDCYQRAEGRYRLMPGIIEALRDAANPFSILTKGSLILRDLPLLEEAAERTRVGAAVSVGFVDKELWRLIEPGTPSPHKRLEVCATLGEHGIALQRADGPDRPLPQRHAAPARRRGPRRSPRPAPRRCRPIVLHLRPGAREWFMTWLREHHPELVGPYERLYGRGAYAPKDYQRRIGEKVAELAARHGIDRDRDTRRVPAAPPPAPPGPEQLTLL